MTTERIIGSKNPIKIVLTTAIHELATNIFRNQTGMLPEELERAEQKEEVTPPPNSPQS